MCIEYIFIKTFKKTYSSFFGPYPQGGTALVKIRLKALAKPTFEMSLGVIETCFQHRKLYPFGDRKRGSPAFQDRGDVPKTY